MIEQKKNSLFLSRIAAQRSVDRDYQQGLPPSASDMSHALWLDHNRVRCSTMLLGVASFVPLFQIKELFLYGVELSEVFDSIRTRDRMSERLCTLRRVVQWKSFDDHSTRAEACTNVRSDL